MESKEQRPGSDGAAAVIVAAGSSTRMGLGEGERKVFLDLEGRTVLERACEAFARSARVREIIIVAHADDCARVQAMSLGSPLLQKVSAGVVGGTER